VRRGRGRLSELAEILREIRANPEVVAINIVRDVARDREKLRWLIRVLVAAIRREPSIREDLRRVGYVILAVVERA
jgi:hypothetical protein